MPTELRTIWTYHLGSLRQLPMDFAVPYHLSTYLGYLTKSVTKAPSTLTQLRMKSVFATDLNKRNQKNKAGQAPIHMSRCICWLWFRQMTKGPNNKDATMLNGNAPTGSIKEEGSTEGRSKTLH